MITITEKQLKSEFCDKLAFLKNNDLDFNKSCIVFVYNSVAKAKSNDLHISECVYDGEAALIKDAFHSIKGLTLYSFECEDDFILKAPNLRRYYSFVYVYSMAQNLDGTGRRCLIPLLCEYYNFINISSNSASSFFGGNKRLMHDLLESHIRMPRRLFLTHADETLIKSFLDKYQNILLKPNSESASIGIRKITRGQPFDEVISSIKDDIVKYNTVILEEFIDGDEVECTVLPWNGGIVITPPVKIIKNTDFLDYKTVASDNYDFQLYDGELSEVIIDESRSAYNYLRFDSIARFDFIVSKEKTYLFDITPNPTISKCSSANLSVKFIDSDDRTIYLILLLNKLLIPTFNKAK